MPIDFSKMNFSSKYCNKCDERLPKDHFYDQPGNADGKQGKCIECTSSRAKIVRAKKKIELARQYHIDQQMIRG